VLQAINQIGKQFVTLATMEVVEVLYAQMDTVTETIVALKAENKSLKREFQQLKRETDQDRKVLSRLVQISKPNF